MEDTRSWYTKYRSTKVEEYSDDKINAIIKRRFTSEEKRPNVIAIYGTKGCGKTTFCRMVSKYYQCLSPKEDGTPCEECEMCKMINNTLINTEDGVECEGIKEIDATQVKGKDEIMELMDEMKMPPLATKKKILIIDECHKLSEAAQSTLLKDTEDIPNHLVVMYATTDIDKVLPAILSRCQVKIEVHRQSVASMAKILMRISEAEKLHVSKEALELIARENGRIPRDCINALEDIAKNFDGEVTIDNVLEMTDGISNDIYIKFYEAANTGLTEILQFNRMVQDKDMPMKDVISGLMKFTMEAIYIKHGIALDEYTPEHVKTIKRLFNLYKSSDFDMLLQILEYAAKMVSTDDNRNEVLLTTTALRIGKIHLLAMGIAKAQEDAVDENNLSMEAHMKKLEQEEVVSIEDDFKADMSIESIHNEYNAVEVAGASSLLYDMAKLPKDMDEDIEFSKKETDEEETQTVENDDIDKFFE